MKGLAHAIALGLLLALSSGAMGGGAPARTVTLDVKEADVHNVFRLLALVGRVNIVVADGIKGRVTLRLVDVTWEDAFAAVLVSQGLGTVTVGNVILVDTLAHIEQRNRLQADVQARQQEAAPLVTVLIPVDYANADDLAGVLAEFLSDRGSIAVDTRTNTLLVTDVAPRVERIQTVLRQHGSAHGP